MMRFYKWKTIIIIITIKKKKNIFSILIDCSNDLHLIQWGAPHLYCQWLFRTVSTRGSSTFKARPKPIKGKTLVPLGSRTQKVFIVITLHHSFFSSSCCSLTLFSPRLSGTLDVSLTVSLRLSGVLDISLTVSLRLSEASKETVSNYSSKFLSALSK